MRLITIRAQFMAVCAVLIVLMAVLAAVSFWSARRITGQIGTLKTDSIPGQYYAASTSGVFKDYHLYTKMAVEGSGDAAQRLERAVKAATAAEKAVENYATTITLDEDWNLYTKVVNSNEALSTGWKEIQALLASGKTAEASARFAAQMDPLFERVGQEVDAMVEFNHREADRMAANAEQTAQGASRLGLGIAIFATVAGTALAFAAVRRVQASLGESVDELSQVAAQVSASSAQLASAGQSLAEGASKQSASIEETSAAAHQTAQMAEQNQSSAQTAGDLVSKAQMQFGQANTNLEHMVTAMSTIQDSSVKVAKIIKVIDEIAFQTNILALNAAVEAARAGTAGMGFAVVADEVRNLAQRCAQAARDTTVLIQESIESASLGRERTDEVARSIADLTGTSSGLMQLVTNIRSGSADQASGIRQITSAITSIERETQNTSASAEESASAAEELSAQSEQLVAVVNRIGSLAGTRAT